MTREDAQIALRWLTRDRRDMSDDQERRAISVLLYLGWLPGMNDEDAHLMVAVLAECARFT